MFRARSNKLIYNEDYQVGSGITCRNLDLSAPTESEVIVALLATTKTTNAQVYCTFVVQRETAIESDNV